jgi:hypothetical protein
MMNWERAILACVMVLSQLLPGKTGETMINLREEKLHSVPQSDSTGMLTVQTPCSMFFFLSHNRRELVNRLIYELHFD